jgi:predicted RNA-binding Zn ribbon-like protein
VPQDPCPERSALSKAVAAAITESFQAREAYETAQEKGTGEIDAMCVLMKARGALYAVERALREHIHQHGCKI